MSSERYPRRLACYVASHVGIELATRPADLSRTLLAFFSEKVSKYFRVSILRCAAATGHLGSPRPLSVVFVSVPFCFFCRQPCKIPGDSRANRARARRSRSVWRSSCITVRLRSSVLANGRASGARDLVNFSVAAGAPPRALRCTCVSRFSLAWLPRLRVGCCWLSAGRGLTTSSLSIQPRRRQGLLTRCSARGDLLSLGCSPFGSLRISGC